MKIALCGGACLTSNVTRRWWTTSGGREREVTMSFPAKRELLAQIAPRYRAASHAQKSVILDEFVAATGYARKYAIRLLTGPPPAAAAITRPRAAALRPGGAGGAPESPGGGQRHLRQAAGPVPARAGAGAGAARPPGAHRGGARRSCWRSARPRPTACWPRPGAPAAPRGIDHDPAGRAAQAADPDAHLRRLGRRPRPASWRPTWSPTAAARRPAPSCTRWR